MAQQGPNALCLCPACRRFIFSSGTFAGGLIQRLVTELQLKSQLLVYFKLGIEPGLKSTVEEPGTKYRAHVEIIEREIFLYAVRPSADGSPEKPDFVGVLPTLSAA